MTKIFAAFLIFLAGLALMEIADTALARQDKICQEARYLCN